MEMDKYKEYATLFTFQNDYHDEKMETPTNPEYTTNDNT